MEHFESNNERVREKSMYLLHLDTPRIVILASVITGLIVISFLLGMNFIKDGGNEGEKLSQSDMLFNDQRVPGLTDQNIPNPPHSEMNPGPIDSAIAELEKTDGKDKKGDNSLVATENRGNGDILTTDNINEIIQPARDDKQVGRSDHAVIDPPKEKAKKSDKHKAVVKKMNKTDRNKTTASKKKKSTIVPVANDEIQSERGGHGYVIQVASYDKKSKAQGEVSSLKKLQYDAFMDGTKVNGRQYFRVRIGPLSSKDKALKLLNEVQGHDRYAESYMTKE
ncbi:MAG: hypothetical protein CVV44_10975 [Spirochaetae bacterium HGW-Spirochaetae-1]|jgi:cell division septation protein DedD|nr:MAG: hypothetical protein CVV44_10975 [Spirochaetae bacterium HGW-Spirochaetae-1]